MRRVTLDVGLKGLMHHVVLVDCISVSFVKYSMPKGCRGLVRSTGGRLKRVARRKGVRRASESVGSTAMRCISLNVGAQKYSRLSIVYSFVLLLSIPCVCDTLMLV